MGLVNIFRNFRLILEQALTKGASFARRIMQILHCHCVTVKITAIREKKDFYNIIKIILIFLFSL